MKKIILTLAFVLVQYLGYAQQAPNISASSGTNIFTIGTPINPIIITNGGGMIPPSIAGVSTFAGGVTVFPNLSVDGVGTDARFYNPKGICIDNVGNLYVTETSAIRKITPEGLVTTISTASAAGLYTPYGIQIDASGTIFIASSGNNKITKIAANGTITSVAGSAFVSGNTDGNGANASFTNPQGIAIDVTGKIYVSDADANNIRKITLTGDVTTFAGSINTISGNTNGLGNTARFYNPAGLTIDNLGNLYLADQYNSSIRKISPSGNVSTFAGTGFGGSSDGTGTNASFSFPNSIAIDTQGYFYVSDYLNHKIRKISPQGVVTTLAGSGNSGSENGTFLTSSFNNTEGLAVDNSGNVFVVDSGNNLIRKITQYGYVITPALPTGLMLDVTTGSIKGNPSVTTPPTVYTITAYNSSGNSSTKLSIATISANLASISFSSGNLNESFVSATTSYTANVGTTSITAKALDATATIKISINGGLYTSIPNGSASGTLPLNLGANTINLKVTASDGVTTKTYTIDATKILAPVISYVTPQQYAGGVAITPLVPTNLGGNVFFGQVTTIAGDGTTGILDGYGNNTKFNLPIGIAVNSTNNLFIADTGNGLIRKIDDTGLVSSFVGGAGAVAGTIGSVDGTGNAASFFSPEGIVVDASGNIYVADYLGNKIRKITPSGVVTTFAGSGTSGSYDGLGTSASFNQPMGMCIDTQGNLFVADYGNNKIRKINSAGNVSTVAGNGTTGAINGNGSSSSFNYPMGITIDQSGNLFVTDYGNNLIRKISSTGLVTTFAGIGIKTSVDGTLVNACFNSPYGITIDSSSNLYVTDSDGYKIRKITTDGYVYTIAGNGDIGSVDNQLGTNSSFYNPKGITIDSNKSLFVCDTGNKKIRKITQLGYSVSPALPAGLYINEATGTISGIPTINTPATNYTITACNVAGCSTATLNISTTALGTTFFNKVKMTVYPNPAKNQINLQFPNQVSVDKIVITDLTGKVILTQTTNTTQVNLSPLSNGMYILEAFSGEEKYSSKFIKE